MTSLPLTPNYADHILVASPSSAVRQRVLESLRSPDRRVEQASGGAEALGHLENGLWQVLFLDRSLPDLNAEELTQIIRQRFPAVEIVLLDSESDARMPAAEKQRVVIPVLEPAAIESAFPSRAPAVNSILQAPLPGMIGGSWKMQPVYRAARLLARRETTVLVTGATGCGKELVARAIHNLSPRAARAFVVINCAAIPEALLESELFGHTRFVEPGLKAALSKKVHLYEQAPRACLRRSASRGRAGARPGGTTSAGALPRTPASRTTAPSRA